MSTEEKEVHLQKQLSSWGSQIPNGKMTRDSDEHSKTEPALQAQVHPHASLQHLVSTETLTPKS